MEPTTTPMCTLLEHQQAGSNTGPSRIDGQTRRPANRDTHSLVPQEIDPTTPQRACETCDTSEDHCPGDLEMPVPTLTTPTVHKVLSPRGHSNRQSLNPPTAWPHAHPSSLPDEDSTEPKRVANSERCQPKTPNDNTISPQTIQTTTIPTKTRSQTGPTHMPLRRFHIPTPLHHIV